ncbi:hypothetical protein BDD12DRAFT_786370 [Trichophaea hybrida]|nr:hypothetical protein BDD12DRAFT_786370 [Trichophaea hybrida]
MKSFIRCTSKNVSAAVPPISTLHSTSLRHPLVLPFLAPAVYHSTVTTRKFSNGRRGNAEPLAPGWNKALNQGDLRTIQGVRARLEHDISDTERRTDEPQTTVPNRPVEFSRKVYFTDEEVVDAYANLRAVMSKHEGYDMSLTALTQRKRRLPKYLYAVIPDAIAGVEREIQALENEIEMVEHDRKHRRQHRYSVRYLLDRGRSIEAISKQVQSLFPSSRSKHFELCMAYLIHYQRLFRLSATVMEGFVKSHIAPDPRLIGKVYHMLIAERLAPFEDADGNRRRRQKMQKVAGECTELLLRMIAQTNRGQIKIPQAALYLLITKAPASILANLYWKLVNNQIFVKQFTTFHFTRRLSLPEPITGISHWKDAQKILRSMQYREYDLSEVPAKSAFYGVLYQAMRAKDAEATEEMLRLMAECGLEPGVEVYNMLMARAAEENDDAALQRYFEAMIDAGYEPNMITYSISHAFHKRHRNERLCQSVVRQAQEIDASLNLFLATDILHSAVLREKPYLEVFQQFKSLFKAKLLEDFGIAPLRGVTRDMTTERRKMAPDNVTLAVMVTSYCNTERIISNIWSLYKLYRQKLTDKTPPNRTLRQMLLINGSYIPHAIMLGLGKRIQGLPYVAAVLEDMLKPNAPIESDVFTWSIFLNFLTRAGRMDEAETVMKVMRTRGHDPNTVTFTTLLNGYVKSNMAETAEEVLGRMDQAGVETNVYTWTALLHGYVKNGDNWRAGDVFRRMLDASVQPDEVTLQAVSGITDRGIFEKGLGGDCVDEEGRVIGRVEDVDQQESVLKEQGADDWFDDDDEGGPQLQDIMARRL